MKLATTEFPGTGETPPLIVAHGLFGSARNWRALAKRLAGGRDAIAVDMRNHGASPHDPAHDYHALAGDLAEVIESYGGRAIVLGHSMGGKASMVLAQTRPELVEQLIIADIGPIAYGHTPRPQIAAMRSLDLDGMTRRSEVEAALAPLVTEPGVAGFLAQNAVLNDGAPRWTLNLDALDDQMEHLVGFPDETGVYDGPALFVYGGASDYVPPSCHDKIRNLFPRVVFKEIAGAGHWLHAEKPREFIAAVAAFLEE